MKLNTPITVDHARIARVLEEGCAHGCTGDAALVKRRIAGGGFQIWIQCLTIAKVAEAGLDVFPLPSGFAALVRENGHLTFMAATASAILAAVQPRQSTEEKADSLFQLKGARA